MRTLHVVILAGAILGAAWNLRPASVEQVSQVELQRREELMLWAQERFTEAKARECAVSAGKTFETLDRSDPKQEAVYRKCMWPEESHGRLRRAWDKVWATIQ
jgi:hypothetical protein